MKFSSQHFVRRAWNVFGMTLTVSMVGAAMAAQGQDKPTPKTVQTAMQAGMQGASGDALAAQVRTLFGGDENLRKGSGAKIEGMTAVFAIEADNPQRPPVVQSDNGSALYLPLTRLGSSNIYAASQTLSDGAGMVFSYIVDGRKIGGGQFEVYKPNPENQSLPGVPKGKVTKQANWRSQVFAGTEREWWVYVPAQYTPDKPACVMVFQDGGGYTSFVPTVFDNLIAKGDMPVTVGIFLNPGFFPDQRDGNGNPRSNRSFEYDTLSDQYARFLLEEILPEVEKTTKLRHDPASRAISGLSSGGICAFTVAWERPNEFGKVLSWIGSFTNIASGASKREGGHNYPALIRKTDAKPLRVFLQDGDNDLDNVHGSWPLANQQMARALAFKNYDYKFVFGHGFHSNNHGRTILPDSLRWLWRDYKP